MAEPDWSAAIGATNRVMDAWQERWRGLNVDDPNFLAEWLKLLRQDLIEFEAGEGPVLAKAQWQLILITHALKRLPGVGARLDLLDTLASELGYLLDGGDPETFKGRLREGTRPPLSAAQEAAAVFAARSVEVLRPHRSTLKQAYSDVAASFAKRGLRNAHGRLVTTGTVKAWHNRSTTGAGEDGLRIGFMLANEADPLPRFDNPRDAFEYVRQSAERAARLFPKDL